MIKHALKILGSVTVGMTALTVKMNITVQVRENDNNITVQVRENDNNITVQVR